MCADKNHVFLTSGSRICHAGGKHILVVCRAEAVLTKFPTGATTGLREASIILLVCRAEAVVNRVPY